MRIEIRLRDLAWIALLAVVLIAARAAPSANHWEYFAISQSHATGMEETLNDRASEGWEPVSCFIMPDGSRHLITCILKRAQS